MASTTPFKLKINVDTKLVRDKLNKIRSRLPTMDMRLSRRYTMGLLRTLKRNMVFKHPTGRMKRETKHKKMSKNVYGIFMPYYAWYVDKGRKPGKGLASPFPLQFRKWANSAGIDPIHLSHIIKTKGVRGNRFIRKSIRMHNLTFRKEYKREIRKIIRGG